MEDRLPTLSQPLVADLLVRVWDALVVGAGPAGGACALELARRGRAVALMDREGFPRDKVCGGGLIADSMAALAGLGLLEEAKAAGHTLRSLSLFSPSQIEVRARGEYLTIRRSVLDAAIARRAVELGATFCRGAVEALAVLPDGTVVARTEDGAALRARTAVLATGVRLGLAESLGMVSRAQVTPDAVAICRDFRSDARIDSLVASFDRSVLPGYAWVFPLGNGQVNVGCGVFHRSARRAPPDLRRTFEAFAGEFPLAREVLRCGEPVGPFRGAPLRCSLRGAPPLGPGPILCAGETLGTTFPFTGEGIGKALETGVMAAEVIDAALAAGDLGALRRYPERIEQELRPKYRGYEIAEAWIRWPWLIDFLSRRVLKSRRLQVAASGILRETTDPREIFSLRGILRSLL